MPTHRQKQLSPQQLAVRKFQARPRRQALMTPRQMAIQKFKAKRQMRSMLQAFRAQQKKSAGGGSFSISSNIAQCGLCTAPSNAANASNSSRFFFPFQVPPNNDCKLCTSVPGQLQFPFCTLNQTQEAALPGPLFFDNPFTPASLNALPGSMFP